MNLIVLKNKKGLLVKTTPFMEAFLKKEKFIPIDIDKKNNKLKSSNKIKQKIFLLYILLSKLKKITFKKPEKKKFIIFDDVGSYELTKILSKEESFVLISRTERIDTIYLNFSLIYNMIVSYRKLPLRLAYLAAVINQVNPYTVLTFIHHSADFKRISGIFKNKIKFIPIQNADTSHMPYELGKNKIDLASNKECFFSEFFCFSSFDEEIFKKAKMNVQKYVHVGSLRASLAKKYAEEKKIVFNENNKYDFCVVGKEVFHTHGGKKNKIFEENNHDNRSLQNFYILNTHLSKFCKKYNFKICAALKSMAVNNKTQKSSNEDVQPYKLDTIIKSEKFEYRSQRYFFDKIYGENNIDIIPRVENTYSTYTAVMNSKFIICTHDTVLREAIIFKKKFLCCSYFEDTQIEEACSGLQLLTDQSYEAFEKRVLQIENMSNEEFYKQVNPSADFRMSNNNTIDAIHNLGNSL